MTSQPRFTGLTLAVDQTIPQGWAWARAEDVCIKIQDGTHFSPKEQLSSGKYRYITAKNIRPYGLDLSNVSYLKAQDHRAIYSRCDAKRDDVLLVKDGVNTGDAAINTLDDEISILSSVCLLRPLPAALSAAFLRYFLLSPTGYRLLTGQMTGTAIKRIILRRIKETPFPIAPIPEQNRIVAEIERHLTRLDAAVAALKRVQANLKRYRASVLKAACEGRLVPTEAELARREGRSYETGAQLLARILKERYDRWETDQLAKMNAAGKSPTHDKWKSKHQEPAAPDTGRLPQLPEGWSWATVGQLGAVGEQPVLTGPFGTSLGRGDFTSTGVPVLTIGCLTDRGISLERAVFVSGDKAASLERYRLRFGDLLFSRMASVGRAGVVGQTLVGALINYHIMRLRLAPGALLPEYYVAYVRGCTQVEKYIREVNHGATRDGINTDQLLSMPVALPPLIEQQRIIAAAEQRFSVTHELEAIAEGNLRRAERLRQAILKRAFEGKLVRQDPNDEPASALLERIRGARSDQATSRRSSPKKCLEKSR